VAMVAVSLRRPHFAPIARRKRAVCKKDHNGARRNDREVELAMSRTVPAAYSQTATIALTLR
jgi:hypothetical protein